MIKFRVKTEPIWVYCDRKEFDKTEIGFYTKEERKGVGFLIEPLSPYSLRDLLKKHSKKQPLDMDVVDKLAKTIKDNFSDGEQQVKEFAGAFGVVQEMTNKEEINWIDYNLEVVCGAVKDWKGIIGEDDKPIECDDARKKDIFLAYPMLLRAILEIATIIRSKYDEFQQEKDQSEEKNLETTSSG